MTDYTATAELPVAEPIALTLEQVQGELFDFPALASGNTLAVRYTGELNPPPGTTFDSEGLNGTPTTAGDYVLTMAERNSRGSIVNNFVGTLTIAPPPATEVTPAAPTFTEDEYVIPETTGVAYQVNGTPTDAGTYPAASSSTVTVTATAEEGYVIVGESSWTHTYPDADPSEEVPEIIDTLAPAVAAFVGRPGDTTTEGQAGAALLVVLDFVRAYTRGNGFTGYRPEYPLRSVLISATARLVTNPEQVRQYQIADYSESPAVLNGYTLAELGLLRRYRRTQA